VSDLIVVLEGCDDTTAICVPDMPGRDALLVLLRDESERVSSYGCMPRLKVFVPCSVCGGTGEQADGERDGCGDLPQCKSCYGDGYGKAWEESK
jgi:hypothetical protein